MMRLMMVIVLVAMQLGQRLLRLLLLLIDIVIIVVMMLTHVAHVVVGRAERLLSQNRNRRLIEVAMHRGRVAAIAALVAGR